MWLLTFCQILVQTHSTNLRPIFCFIINKKLCSVYIYKINVFVFTPANYTYQYKHWKIRLGIQKHIFIFTPDPLRGKENRLPYVTTLTYFKNVTEKLAMTTQTNDLTYLPTNSGRTGPYRFVLFPSHSLYSFKLLINLMIIVRQSRLPKYLHPSTYILQVCFV